VPLITWCAKSIGWQVTLYIDVIGILATLDKYANLLIFHTLKSISMAFYTELALYKELLSYQNKQKYMKIFFLSKKLENKRIQINVK